MKAVYIWECWDCKTRGTEVTSDGETITISELLAKAREDVSRKYYNATIYCPKCEADKATLTVPTGLTVAFAVDGRVSILTTYEEGETEEISYSL